MPGADRNSGGGVGLLVLLGAGFLGYKFLNRSVVEPLKTKAYVERIRLGKIYGVKFKKDTVEFKFPIENPNTAPMTIKAIVGEVYVTTHKGTIKIGAVNHFGTDVIKPVGSTDFDLVVKIKLLNEVLLMADITRNGMTGIKITFKGTITANDRPWPVNETIQIA